MQRLMAIVFLVLLLFALLYSFYCFAQGRFSDALYIYPLLITIYVMMKLGDRGSKGQDDDGPGR